MKNQFKVNQIVKGKVAGHFVVLGFRSDLGNEVFAKLKSVNPKNFGEVSKGELALPLSALEAVEQFNSKVYRVRAVN